MSTVILYSTSELALEWCGQAFMIFPIEIVSKPWTALCLTPTGTHLEQVGEPGASRRLLYMSTVGQW